MEFCAEGRFIEEFAHEIKVHKDTLYEWGKVHKDFSDALKRAKQANRVWFLKKLRQGYIGQIRNFNAGAGIFLLKAIHGLRDDMAEEEPQDVELEFYE